MLEQLKDVLKSLKWTESQASVYCTLVEKGTMKPADLVIAAGVAQGKIYSVLDDLEHTKGAIVKVSSSPAKYDVQNPRHVLNKLIGDVEKMKDLALQDAEQAYEKRYDQFVGKNNCWSVQGISGMMIQLRSLIDSCKKSLKICDSDLNWIGKPERKMLIKAMKGRRKVSILGTDAFKEELSDLQNNGADVKVSKSLPSYYLIDDEVILLRFNSPDSCVVIKDKEFVEKKILEFDNDFNQADKVMVPKIET